LVLKIATLAPEGSAWIKALSTLNGEIIKKTEKQVQFKIYPGGVMGDEKDMLRKMQIGQLHGAVLTAASLSAIFDEIDVFQTPFLFQSYEEVDHVIAKMDSFFRKGFEDNGYVLLAWSEGGFVYLMSKAPMVSVAEFRKGKVWTWEESPMAKAIFDEAGISAIPLSVPDVLVGLQTGLVDVVYAPPQGAIALQWFTRVKYLVDVPLLYLVGGIVLNRKAFEQIPQAQQGILLESCRSYMSQLRMVLRRENQEAIKVMEKHGVKVLKPTKEQVEEFKSLWDRAMLRPGAQSFSKKVLEEVIAHVEAFRKGAR
jgi:TRAP-type C4-dicarboxylate transport system substrate-binding protein